MKDNTQAAVDLAAFNWCVLPLHSPRGATCDCGASDCRSPAKHPRIRGWADWKENPTPEDAASWWGMWAHANIGIVAGASGVVVLDVDPRHDGVETLKKLTDEHGVIPHGPRVRTGSGGWHFYFRHPKVPVGNSSGSSHGVTSHS